MTSGSRLWLVAAVVIGLAAAVLAGCARQQAPATPTAEPEAGHEGMAMTEGGAMVACAYDGMIMKQTGMGAQMDYRGDTVYFCNADEKAKFQAAPEKYLREMSLGEGVAASAHIMPVTEYGETMSRMGAMMDYQFKPGATHHMNVAVFDGGEPVADATVSLTVTDPSGQAATYRAAYVKALKAYGADIALPKSGEYGVSVEVAHGAETMSGSFRYRP